MNVNKQYVVFNYPDLCGLSYNKDGYYDFSVEIKDFDTPNINLKFDYDKGKIVTMWIDIYEDENEPKNHVVYKLFDLCKYNISTILKFMIEHK